MPSETHPWIPFHIPAMDCPEEFRLIDKSLRGELGILDLQANYMDRVVRIQFDDAQTSPDDIRQRLKDIGFPPRPVVADGAAAPYSNWRATCVVAGFVLLVAAAVAYFAGATVFVYASLAALSACVAGAPVAQSAWRSIKLHHLDMNVLMIIAAVGALAIGEWFEAATAMTLFGVANWLESLSLRRAGQAISALANLLPDTAHLISRADSCNHSASNVPDSEPDIGRVPHDHQHDHQHSGSSITEIPIASLLVDDVVLVRPGEHFPIDGRIVDGSSAVTEAALTGESVPVPKRSGDNVLAGTVNGEGALQVIATATADDSAMSQVSRLVNEARTNRSRAEQFVDRFARYYTPIVIVLACLVAFVVPLVLTVTTPTAWVTTFPDWFHRGLVLLVIACPCALVISTPITIVCGLQRAAAAGILVKGGDSLDAAADVDALAIDKTGTLTEGRPVVQEIVPADDMTAEQVLGLAAALEAHSAHPLATAILAAAQERHIRPPAVENMQAVPGLGVSGTVSGKPVRVGTWEFVSEAIRHGNSSPPADEEETGGFVFVGSDRALGVIRLQDQLRADAAQGIADLADLGLDHTTILTGDRLATANQIAAAVEINQVHAQLMPAEKVSHVQRIRDEGYAVAMVGDGFNDAPALAAAHLGVAMGGEASSLALESADVVILSPQVRSIGRLIRLARFTRHRLWQNIGLALFMKAIILLITAAGYGTMWLAVAADVGASLVVIFNGMRLLGAKLDS